MFNKRKFNLMIGPSIFDKGGISTVAANYYECGFCKEYAVRHLSLNLSGVGRVTAIVFFAFALMKLLFILLFNQVALAHVHLASRGSYSRKSIVVRILKIFNVKVILHLHGGGFKDFYNNECNDKKKRHIRDTFEMVDKVIVLSSQWLVWAGNVFPRIDHFIVLNNSVSSPIKIQDSVLSRVIGKIIFFGRINDLKGVSDLLKAFVIVKKSCPLARLHFAGIGDLGFYKSMAKDLGISDSVILLGWISGSEKFYELATSDVYCLPSYIEGFPMSIVEAMSLGIPVVSTAVGGIPDAIDSGNDGILIEPGDVDSLARVLITLVIDRSLNDALSSAGKSKFFANFSHDVVIPKLRLIYDELLYGLK